MFRYFKKIAAVGCASVLQVVLLAILSLLLAKFLSIEDFGIIRTVTAYMVVLSILGHFCLHDAVSAYVAGAVCEKVQQKYIFHASLLVLIISFIVTILIGLIVNFTEIWTGRLKDTFLAITMFLPIVSLTIVYTSLLQAAGSYRKLTFSLIIGGLAQFLIIAPVSAYWGLDGWILSRCFVYLFIFGVSLYFVKNLISWCSYDSAIVGELAAFARIQIFSGILSMVLQSADIIALERLSGDMTEVAVYGLAALFGRSLMVLPGAIGRIYFRKIAESVSNGDGGWKEISHMLLVTIVLCLLISLFLYIFVPVIIEIFYKNNYFASIEILKIMCVGVVFSGLWSALSVINVASKKPSHALIISLVGVVTCLISLAILIPKFGAKGAAWGMNCSYALGSVVGLSMLFKKNRIHNSV